MPSSRVIVFALGPAPTVTGTTSFWNSPCSQAAAARRWLWAAKRSWSARVTWHLRGDVLGGLAHVPVFEGAPQTVVDHGIDGFLVAILPAGPRAHEQVRRPAHALHAAGQNDLRIAGADGLGRQHDCLEAGAANLVDRDRRDGVGQARLERRLPGRVLAHAGLQDVAHDDFIDVARRERRRGAWPRPARRRLSCGAESSARPPRNLPIGVRTADKRKASVMVYHPARVVGYFNYKAGNAA